MVKVVITKPEKVFIPTERELTRFTQQAINETLKRTRTQARRLVQQELNIKTQAFSEKGSRPVVSTKKASSRNPDGELRFTNQEQPLDVFKGVRAGKKGIAATIKKSKGRKVIRSGFKATVTSPINQASKTGFFIRKVKSGSRVSRLPIQRIFTTTIREQIDQESIQRDLTQFVSEQLEKSFIRRIDASKFKGLF